MHELQAPERFRGARRQLQLSCADLAAFLMMGKGAGRTIRRWESGDSPIPGPAALLIGIWLDQPNLMMRSGRLRAELEKR